MAKGSPLERLGTPQVFKCITSARPCSALPQRGQPEPSEAPEGGLELVDGGRGSGAGLAFGRRGALAPRARGSTEKPWLGGFESGRSADAARAAMWREGTVRSSSSAASGASRLKGMSTSEFHSFGSVRAGRALGPGRGRRSSLASRPACHFIRRNGGLGSSFNGGPSLASHSGAGRRRSGLPDPACLGGSDPRRSAWKVRCVSHAGQLQSSLCAPDGAAAPGSIVRSAA